jgi:hypothetical protein
VKRKRMERLAEAIANGAPTVKAAAAMLGIHQSVASRYWNEICDRLGPQAGERARKGAWR